MNALSDFLICKLNFKVFLLWKTPNENIRGYQLHVAKKDMEIARAFLNVERRKQLR